MLILNLYTNLSNNWLKLIVFTVLNKSILYNGYKKNYVSAISRFFSLINEINIPC